MEMIVDVKSVSRFDFKADDGKELKGTKIFYEGQPVNTPNKKGVEVLQINSDSLEVFDEFTIVPAKYKIGFQLVPGKGGQVKMQYLSCQLIKN